MILGVLSYVVNPYQVIHYKAQIPVLITSPQWQSIAMLFAALVILYFLYVINRLKRKNQELEAFNFDLNKELVERAVIEKRLRDKTIEMEKHIKKKKKEEKKT